MTTSSSPPAPSSLVYVIDDVEGNRLLAQAYLRRIGWEVRCFPSAAEALQALEQETPAAMLIDVRMPGMSGDELARMLRTRRQTATLRLVGYTAHALKDEVQTFLEAGFDHVLIKPALMADMAAAFPRPPAA